MGQNGLRALTRQRSRIERCATLVAVILFGLSLASCGRPLHDFASRSIGMEPHSGVAVTATLKDLIDKSEIIRGMTFLRFEYTVDNRSAAPVLFSVAEVRLRAAGVMSVDSWYDAPWDSTRHWDTIDCGRRAATSCIRSSPHRCRSKANRPSKSFCPGSNERNGSL